MKSDEPKICQECVHKPAPSESDPYPDCGGYPQLCALAKARWVKRIKREAAEKGVSATDLAADYQAIGERRVLDEYQGQFEFWQSQGMA